MNITTRNLSAQIIAAENQEKAVTAGIIEAAVKALNAQIKNNDLCLSVCTFISLLINEGKRNEHTYYFARKLNRETPREIY